MAFFDDITIWNEANNTSNWTSIGSLFPNPLLNNSGSTPTFYMPDATNSCIQFEAKKSSTNAGYYASITSEDIAGKVFMALFMIFAADVTNIPLTALAWQVSSSTGFTTNYNRYEALDQIDATGGWTKVYGYLPEPTSSGGSPNESAIIRVGWIMTTGGGADGKLAGFERSISASYFGGHSELVELSDIQARNDATNNFLTTTAGSIFQTKVRIHLGLAGATATTSFDETGKSIFFNNLHPNHELGWEFINATSFENHFDLDNCVVSWNTGQTATNKVFTGVQNTDEFRIVSSSFTNGGEVELRSYVSDTETFVKNCAFANCREVDIKDIIFEGNTVSGSVSGVRYAGTGTRRASGNSYTNNTDALHFDTAQTITLDGDTFSGNTTDIHFSGTGTLTINTSNGANPTTSRVTGGGTVVINNDTTITLTGLQDNTEVTVYDSGTGALIAEVENVVSNTFQFSDVAANVIDIYIHNVAYYRADILNFTVPSTDASIPVQQVPDSNYVNN